MTLSISPRPSYPIGAQEFQEILNRIDRFLNQINDRIQCRYDNCNRLLDRLPKFLTENVVSALHRLRDLAGQFFTEMSKLCMNPGWPPGLQEAANDWTNRVGGPVSGLASTDWRMKY